jgi:hypothetical protein
MALLVMQAVIAPMRVKPFPTPGKVMLVPVMRIAIETMIAFHDF